MLTDIIMPKLGETMEEGTIARWVKKEGEEVKKGDILLEITTDKATLEVESYGSGILKKILVPEGQTVPINTVIAVLGEPDDEIPPELLKEISEKVEEKPAEAKAIPSAPPGAAEGAVVE